VSDWRLDHIQARGGSHRRRVKVALSAEERDRLIERYARGPERIRAALARVPEKARQWRPGPGKWSAHEVVVHCADSETNAALRLRYLLAEKDPLIVGYDQAEWARRFDYHSLPLEPALAAVEATRGLTVPLLRRLEGADWAREGRHTESGRYTPEDWLRIYAEHLEKHAGQIERNLEAWKSAGA
jgi:hypothetical protein